MKPEDFEMYSDPRVREVMAAAANLVEAVNTQHALQDVDGPMIWLKKVPLNMARDVLVAALFAAQHSKPMSKCTRCGARNVWHPSCDACFAYVPKEEAAQHSAPKPENCSECGAHPAMLGKCQNAWCKHRPAQHSKPKFDWSKNRLRLGESDD